MRRSAKRARFPAVAGSFYPADPADLAREVRRLLDAAGDGSEETAVRRPKALVVPHAGYVYSGPVAASAYCALRARTGSVERVVLLGPAHHVPVRGLAVPSAEVFATPLGELPLDRAALDALRALPQVVVSDAAHADEHSLEVQLPFLQEALGRFALVPLAVGDASPAQVAEVLELLWDGPETLIVVTTDLSHFHGYDAARLLDERTCRAIETLHAEELGPDRACGHVPLAGLLIAARSRGLRVSTVDLRSSGDTAGSHDSVVGYGAWLLA